VGHDDSGNECRWAAIYLAHTGVPKYGIQTTYYLIEDVVHGKNVSDKKNQLFLLLLLTVIQCKQRYIRTSLPCNHFSATLKKIL
jgi:hypothetical protein